MGIEIFAQWMSSVFQQGALVLLTTVIVDAVALFLAGRIAGEYEMSLGKAAVMAVLGKACLFLLSTLPITIPGLGANTPLALGFLVMLLIVAGSLDISFGRAVGVWVIYAMVVYAGLRAGLVSGSQTFVRFFPEAMGS